MKQIGCGYCNKEKWCDKRDPKVNKAKEGCPDFKHWAKPLCYLYEWTRDHPPIVKEFIEGYVKINKKK